MTNPSLLQMVPETSELAPAGRLRAGINYSNFLIVQRNAATGELKGIAPDLAAEAARRLGVPVELVPYDSPSKMGDDAGSGKWDVAFLGAEPARAEMIAFTAAYLEIPSGYLVPAGSKLKSVEEVDRPGTRIAIAARAAYDLYLTRSLKHAELVRASGIEGSEHLFVNEKLDALAGLKPALIASAGRIAGSRLLDGHFTAVQQAIGTPKARSASAAAWLRAFAEDAKASGLVAKLIAKHGIQGVNVAPPDGR
jgi:polar amino acid transport system substrate-binding protein